VEYNDDSSSEKSINVHFADPAKHGLLDGGHTYRVVTEEAAALAGLAPFDDDSGKHKGQRHIAGGRGRLRRSLYAAALPAAFRWNKALVMLYARLTARGKAHNAALIACARKLLVYACIMETARTLGRLFFDIVMLVAFGATWTRLLFSR